MDSTFFFSVLTDTAEWAVLCMSRFKVYVYKMMMMSRVFNRILVKDDLF